MYLADHEKRDKTRTIQKHRQRTHSGPFPFFQIGTLLRRRCSPVSIAQHHKLRSVVVKRGQGRGSDVVLQDEEHEEKGRLKSAAGRSARQTRQCRLANSHRLVFVVATLLFSHLWVRTQTNLKQRRGSASPLIALLRACASSASAIFACR